MAHRREGNGFVDVHLELLDRLGLSVCHTCDVVVLYGSELFLACHHVVAAVLQIAHQIDPIPISFVEPLERTVRLEAVGDRVQPLVHAAGLTHCNNREPPITDS